MISIAYDPEVAMHSIMKDQEYAKAIVNYQEKDENYNVKYPDVAVQNLERYLELINYKFKNFTRQVTDKKGYTYFQVKRYNAFIDYVKLFLSVYGDIVERQKAKEA